MAQKSKGGAGDLPAGAADKPAAEEPLGKLRRAWEITKILYQNDFTRCVDTLFSAHHLNWTCTA